MLGLHNFRTPQFYVLPKIHKEHNTTLPIGYPVHPIVSACNSRTENILGFIDEIWQHYVKSFDSYVKDTVDFLRKLQNVPYVPKEALLVTLDVTSLYSNIPYNRGIKDCEHVLNSKPSNSDISTESVCDLISTVLKIIFSLMVITTCKLLVVQQVLKWPPVMLPCSWGDLKKIN